MNNFGRKLRKLQAEFIVKEHPLATLSGDDFFQEFNQWLERTQGFRMQKHTNSFMTGIVPTPVITDPKLYVLHLLKWSK